MSDLLTTSFTRRVPPTMASLDANIALRLVLHDVPDQVNKIQKLLANSKPRSLVIEDVVLFECVWVLESGNYNFQRPLIGKLLLQIADTPQFICNRHLLERAVPIYVGTTNISFIDICLAVYAELNDTIPLLTFDKKLAKALPKTVKLL